MTRAKNEAYIYIPLKLNKFKLVGSLGFSKNGIYIPLKLNKFWMSPVTMTSFCPFTFLLS